MNWSLFFTVIGVAYAATWIFKIVDLIEGSSYHEES